MVSTLIVEPLEDTKFSIQPDHECPTHDQIVAVLAVVSPQNILVQYLEDKPRRLNPAELRILKRYVHYYVRGVFCRGCSRNTRGGYLNSDRLCNQCKDKRGMAIGRQILDAGMTMVTNDDLRQQLNKLYPILEYVAQHLQRRRQRLQEKYLKRHIKGIAETKMDIPSYEDLDPNRDDDDPEEYSRSDDSNSESSENDSVSDGDDDDDDNNSVLKPKVVGGSATVTLPVSSVNHHVATLPVVTSQTVLPKPIKVVSKRSASPSPAESQKRIKMSDAKTGPDAKDSVSLSSMTPTTTTFAEVAMNQMDAQLFVLCGLNPITTVDTIFHSPQAIKMWYAFCLQINRPAHSFIASPVWLHYLANMLVYSWAKRNTTLHAEVQGMINKFVSGKTRHIFNPQDYPALAHGVVPRLFAFLVSQCNETTCAATRMEIMQLVRTLFRLYLMPVRSHPVRLATFECDLLDAYASDTTTNLHLITTIQCMVPDTKTQSSLGSFVDKFRSVNQPIKQFEISLRRALATMYQLDVVGVWPIKTVIRHADPVKGGWIEYTNGTTKIPIDSSFADYYESILDDWAVAHKSLAL